MNEQLIWTDFETTGLKSTTHHILEVAVAVADFRDPFNYKHVYHAVLGMPAGLKKDDLDPFIIDMHTKNGLLAECETSKVTIRDVQSHLMGMFPFVEDKEKRPILAGSTISFDHSFIASWMPAFDMHLSHRHYDVSGLKLFCQSKGMLKFPKGEAHRAKLDIEESIAHAKACDEWLANHYRNKDRTDFLSYYSTKNDGDALHDFGG